MKITIFEKFITDVKNNFVKADPGSTSAFGVAYDYGSVMHYSSKSFSRNGNPTIKATVLILKFIYFLQKLH